MSRRPHLPVIDGDVARVPLTRALHAIIDAADAELISTYGCWQARWDASAKTHYASATARQPCDRPSTIQMHRLLLNAQSGLLVDHRNHDGLDNRRDNLRLCSPTQNQHNLRGPQRNGTSGYLGVTWHRRDRRWQAAFVIAGRSHHVGNFSSAVEAAVARDAFVRERFPDDPFSCFNFPLPTVARGETP